MVDFSCVDYRELSTGFEEIDRNSVTVIINVFCKGFFSARSIINIIDAYGNRKREVNTINYTISERNRERETSVRSSALNYFSNILVESRVVIKNPAAILIYVIYSTSQVYEHTRTHTHTHVSIKGDIVSLSRALSFSSRTYKKHRLT